MTCIHGLDEINCPICRINNFSIPDNFLKVKENQIFRNDNPLFRKSSDIKQKLLKDLSPRQIKSPLEPWSLISKPNLINIHPNIKKSLFQKRLNELDISKSDKFGINKRIKVKSPEFEFDKVD